VRTVALVVVEPILAHQHGDGFLSDRKGAAKPATLVTPVQRNQLERLDVLEQHADGMPARFDQLRRRAQPKPAETVTAFVQSDAMREHRANVRYTEHIHQELAQLIRCLPHATYVIRLADRIEMVADVVGTASRRHNDVLERPKSLHVLAHCGGRTTLVPCVCQRLATAGLRRRVCDLTTEPSQKLQRCDPDVRKELIDIAGYEKADIQRRTPAGLLQ
jgi:hypothetical protein